MAPANEFLMEKAATNNQKQPHPSQLHGLRCPRCDSSNTKFCYYNNYSLSQPRHFCKACKRYWTRGGTLRNVPVGGGCRKNKRVKRQSYSSSSPEPASTNTTTANANPSFSSPTTNTISSSASHLNPLFLGFNPRVSSSSMDGFDLLEPQLDVLGLGFSDNGFSSINSLLAPPSYCSPTLPASSFSQLKFQTFAGQPIGGNNGSENFLKGVKMDWSLSYHQEDHHQLGFSDPNSLFWEQ